MAEKQREMEAPSSTASPRKVLCVGLVCADIISYCHTYPEEDSDQRAIDQRWQMGGNAANSSVVLSLLGARAEYMGTLARAPELTFILDKFAEHGVSTEHCVHHENCSTPLSVVIISKQNGSRTIIHSNKSLPELSFEDFKQIDLSKQEYKWIHFEGRPNVIDYKKILFSIDAYNTSIQHKGDKIITSVELEKKRPELEELVHTADFVFVSKEHAVFSGCASMEQAVENFRERCKESATVICAWGEQGAMAMTPDGAKHYSPIYPPQAVVDTLGAGDTFNAATIYALSNGASVQDAISFGCRVAGLKVGIIGFEGLPEKCKAIKS